MTRVLDADYARLEAFLAAYRISEDLGAKPRSQLMRRCHKYVLASLQVRDQLESLVNKGGARINSVDLHAPDDAYEHLGEFFSDLVAALSCLVHGLYKPSGMQLRSAVESLVRGVAGVTSLEARETKSIYRLFEIASGEDPFRGDSVADFATLQQIYGDLCLYVHSGSKAHRAGVYHVALHMRQDTNKMRDVVARVERVCRAALSILVRIDGRLYTACPPRVRDLLDEVLPKDVRLKALGV